MNSENDTKKKVLKVAVIGAALYFLTRRDTTKTQKNMKLSKNFSLAELLYSNTANELGITEQYQPSQEVIANLQALAQNILQPLRDHLQRPIKVTSGYRSLRLNSAMKTKNGKVSKTSQHLQGQAADIVVAGYTPLQLLDIVKQLNLPFDQAITYATTNHLHLSYNPKRQRKEIKRM